MHRFLPVMLLCVLLSACNGSDPTPVTSSRLVVVCVFTGCRINQLALFGSDNRTYSRIPAALSEYGFIMS